MPDLATQLVITPGLVAAVVSIGVAFVTTRTTLRANRAEAKRADERAIRDQRRAELMPAYELLVAAANLAEPVLQAILIHHLGTETMAAYVALTDRARAAEVAVTLASGPADPALVTMRTQVLAPLTDLLVDLGPPMSPTLQFTERMGQVRDGIDATQRRTAAALEELRRPL